MYGFPTQKELSPLIGNNLSMVCCTVNQVYLHLDSEISITINTDQFQVIKSGELTEIKIPIDNLAIFELLEQKVINIEIKDNKTILEILFENRNKIILTDGAHYESHAINIGEKEFLI